jgi:membrane associated rhomboid family serine protease
MAFIPLHDTNPLRHITRPYVAWGLIAANIIIYFFVQSGGISDVSQSSVYSYGLVPAVFNDLVQRPPELTGVPDWLTILTYAFLHGDIWHLLGNMVFVWVFADNIEDALGHVRFFIFYCLCAIGAGYAFVLSDPSSETPVVGASGAVAGIVAAYFLLHPRAKIWVLIFGRIPIRLSAMWVLGFWILVQIYSVFAAGEGEVAWWAHIGGLVCGAVLIVVMRRRGVPLFDQSPEAEIVVVPPKIDGPPPRQ